MTTNSTLTQWNNSVEWYSQIMGEVGDELNREIIRPALLEELGDLKNETLLNVGCGSGYLTAELAKRTKKVVGVDFSSEFIALCQKKYASQSNLSFQLYDVTEKMEFADQSFDIVLSKMVLQYVENISTFALESKRVVKDDGRIIIVVDHPFHRQFYFAQSLVGKTGPNFEGLKDYFSRESQTKVKVTATGEKIELTWYPKTIEDYIKPFVKTGLMLANIRELGENKENITIPRILLLEFKKND